VNLNKRGAIMMTCLILACSKFAAGSDKARTTPDKRMSEMMAGVSAGQAPDAEVAGGKRARPLKEAAPEFRAFQEKLEAIDAKIMKIIENLGRKQIDREAARTELLPLVKEQQEIQSDPEFLVEQRLAQAYFSSPEYRQAVLKAMRGGGR
jgi:hypothetical protein